MSTKCLFECERQIVAKAAGTPQPANAHFQSPANETLKLPDLRPFFFFKLEKQQLPETFI